MLGSALRASLPLLVTACAGIRAPAPEAPRPLRAQAAAPPRGVIRAATRELIAAGFLVTQIDTVAGLRAERQQRPGEFEGILTCRTAVTPQARAAVAPSMIIELSVQPRIDGGSEVVVASRVNAAYLRLAPEPPRPPSNEDCRSTGVVERKLVESLASGP
jgi:hypothetical protein